MKTNKLVTCNINGIVFSDITVGSIISVPGMKVDSVNQEFLVYGDNSEFIYLRVTSSSTTPSLVVTKLKWRDKDGNINTQLKFIDDTIDSDIIEDTELIEELDTKEECEHEINLNSATKKELIQYIKENKLDINTKLKKSELVAALKETIN